MKKHVNCQLCFLHIKLIMIITTVINSQAKLFGLCFSFDALPLWLNVSHPLVSQELAERRTPLRAVKQVTSAMFLEQWLQSICHDPWNSLAVKSQVKGEAENVNWEFDMQLYEFQFNSLCGRDRAAETEGEREWSRVRESRHLLWYLNDYNEFLSSRSAQCCDLIWFLSDAEMLHYQVGSKLCLNQLQWDPVRPSGHRGQVGWNEGGLGGRQEWEKGGFWRCRVWLEFVLISGVWGRMKVWR